MKNIQALDTDTIAAMATPPGKGGVGIIRVSGPKAKDIGRSITRTELKPRYAHFGQFYWHQEQNSGLDMGIAL